MVINNSVLIQYGRTHAGTDGDVYFPIAFSNTAYNITASCLQNTSAWPICWFPYLFSTHFNMDGTGDYSRGDRGILCSWIAVGY